MRTNDWVGKRKAARQPVNMRGEIRFLDGRPPKDCKITDISATGCALEVSEEIVDVDDFDLFIEARNEVKICKIRRSAGLRLGVAFLKSRLDDPLVMQTLMERVLRLERGYAELKGGPVATAPDSDVERRVSNEPRRALDRELAISGPSVDQRIQSVATGLTELRVIVDGLVSGATSVSVAELEPRVDAQAGDIASIKHEMTELASALRGVTLVDAHTPAGATFVDHSMDIAKLKEELANLSLAMREIADRPALRNHALAAAAAEQQSGATTRDLARLRADLSELRAAVDATRGGNAAVDEDARAALAELRAEFEMLRGAVRGGDGVEQVGSGGLLDQHSVGRELLELRAAVDATRGGNTAVDEDARAALAELRAEIELLRDAVSPGDGVDHAAGSNPGDANAVNRELTELRGCVKTLILLVTRALDKSANAQAA